VETKPESGAELAALSVAELISRLSTGTSESSSPYFEELIRRFEPILRATWWRVIAKRKLALGIEYQDFVHDVFVRLFSHLSYLQNHEAFAGYFRRVALSVAYDYLRRQHIEDRNETVSTEELEQHGAVPSTLVTEIDEQILTGILIHSYLNHLTTREREILSLEFFKGLSIKEIATILGLTPGGVRTTKARALSGLRELMLEEAITTTNKSKNA
jgi:RNA polymerase sigma-70 factor (ECF subfamily)